MYLIITYTFCYALATRLLLNNKLMFKLAKLFFLIIIFSFTNRKKNFKNLYVQKIPLLELDNNRLRMYYEKTLHTRPPKNSGLDVVKWSKNVRYNRFLFVNNFFFYLCKYIF